ncbi:MAG: glycosyl transferase [bacterium]|nr:glycosyl transferase [bacterium]
MKFGYFDNEKREYIIEKPDTPMPWINYLGQDGFFGMISNTGSGYTFMIDARKLRLTRYRYNNVPMDGGGRYFYIRDNQTGAFWSPGWLPVKQPLDFYECRHGQGYTVLSSEKDGIGVSIRFFVPPGETLEVWEMDVVNRSAETKSISLFTFVEFCLWEALTDATNLQRTLNLGEVEVEDGVIYHKTEYRERRNHFAFFSSSEKTEGTDTDRDAFLGPYNGFHEPAAVREGRSRDSLACGWNPIGSHHIRMTLQPGETKKINFLLGYAENPEKEKFSSKGVLNKRRVRAVIRKYSDRAQSEKAFQALRKMWDGLFENLQVSTPKKELDTMVNIWNQYQCFITYNMARSTSFFETGIGRGIGFRDACQDLLGVVHFLPKEKSRQRILDLAAIQWRDGACYHQYQLLDKKGNADVGAGFNDDPCWLILATAAYIKETGDWTILNAKADFDNNPKDRATLYEHLKLSFGYILKHLGPHKLPLIGRADWNDCLNLTMTSIKPGDTFQADATAAELTDPIGRVPESLMIAAQFVWAGRELEAMARQRKDAATARRAVKAVADMIRAINRHGWDGEWFLRAYDRFGKKIGSRENPEGKIFIEPQAFMGWAGIGLDDGRLQKAMDSLKKHLYSKHGVVVQQPAYSEYDFYKGEITSYPPGVKENAGVFCHPNGWVVIAECRLGRGENAMMYYRTICPAEREAISDLHKAEPYIYCQMIAGPDSKRFGEGKNSWLTGTASANFYAVSQYLLGIRPEYAGLRIDPCVPKDWKGFTIRRVFRGCRYQIDVTNPRHVNRGVKETTVDGRKVPGNVIPVFKDGKTHKVKVVMG